MFSFKSRSSLKYYYCTNAEREGKWWTLSRIDCNGSIDGISYGIMRRNGSLGMKRYRRKTSLYYVFLHRSVRTCVNVVCTFLFIELREKIVIFELLDFERIDGFLVFIDNDHCQLICVRRRGKICIKIEKVNSNLLYYRWLRVNWRKDIWKIRSKHQWSVVNLSKIN